MGKDQSSLQDKIDLIKSIFIDNNIFEGMEIIIPLEDAKVDKTSSYNATVSETVPLVIAADNLIDYRPCRPQDFVGRSELQREIWQFLEKVRKNSTDTRILALSGQSGFGKSSISIKVGR